MTSSGAWDLTRAVAQYHAGCLRVIGAQNVALRDVRTTARAALCVDVGSLADREELLADRSTVLRAPPAPPADATDDEKLEHQHQQIVWDRLRDLTAKAAVESHAKEVVYGAPLVRGFLTKLRGSKLDPILAPLFMIGVSLTVESDGAIRVTATDEAPRFNTAVWKDAIKDEHVKQIVEVGLEAQADLAAGYDPARIETLLKALQSVAPFIELGEPSVALERWPDLPDPWHRPEESELQLFDGAVLFLANRASPYLLHDLEKIAEDPENLLKSHRPLAVLVNPPSDEEREAAIGLPLEEVIYPFPSNAAQRQVADALEKNEIVVVQGPPGDGKSLTIANLVAHLVAHGKRVLVSSHKQQALTVVRDKLAESELRFLYASLIGDGVAAKRELQRQIADVKAFAGTASRAALAKQLKDLERSRSASGERYHELHDDFVTRAEPEQAEAAHLFEIFRGVATLPIEDPALPTGEQSSASSALRRLDELVREHGDVWASLRRSSVAASGDVAEALSQLGAFIEHQEARLAAASDKRVGELVRRWHPITAADPEEILRAREVIAGLRRQLAPVLVAAEARDPAFKLAAAPNLLTDAERDTAALEQAFARARELAQGRAVLSVAPDLRAQILSQHELLRSLVKRRGARKWLDQHAPGAAGLSTAQLSQWAGFWDAWSRVVVAADGLAGGLRGVVPQTFDPDAAQAIVSRARAAIAHAKAITVARGMVTKTAVPLPLADALAAESAADLDATLLPWQQALAAADADRVGNILKVDASLEFLAGTPAKTDELIDAGRYDEAAEAVASLKRVLAALPSLVERRRLLDGALAALPGSTERVELAAELGDPAPDFLGEIEQALAVHESVLRFATISSTPGTRELAEQLSGLTSQVMDDARRLLGGRIQERILAGFRNPSFLSSLEMFRKAVSGSPKRFERFEELKSSPGFNVEILTQVFPCWIMRPEDACRVFPLRSDVFDVLIMDEASQCNPDQALPLFARAKSVAIFGDEKQLSNEDLKRTLSGDANRALLRQSGLDKLDPAGLFDQTKNSLLEVASQRQQASVLLNEHFRCRPEIIAFSNDRFYGSTLRVMRDREDDRGLGPAQIVRQVEVRDPVPTARGTKVNYLEAEALVEDLVRRLDDPRYARMTFGVLSLFREQVTHLETLIEDRVSLEQRERHRLICSTVDGFQGDERDVILYSWRYTAADHPSVFAFTNGGAGEQRTNVALTRARNQAIHFISVPIERFPTSAANVSGYLKHAANPDRLLATVEARVHREPSGPARDALRVGLESEGCEVTEDYVACGVSIDLLVRDRAALKRVAVFVDADRAKHRPPDVPERVDQHGLLERAGWTVVRAAATETLPCLGEAVARVRAALDASPELTPASVHEAHQAVVVVDARGLPVPTGDILDLEIEAEDRADYNWSVPSVEARLAAGEPVFMSDFEWQLFDLLAANSDLKVVPQWPSRGKSIDLVITDRLGRRLAVEADGAQHHRTADGGLIPADLDRQAFLEEAGWVFCRVDHHGFTANPTGEVARVLDVLHAQPPNPELAARVWGTPEVDDALSVPVELVSEPVETGTGNDELTVDSVPPSEPWATKAVLPGLETSPQSGGAGANGDRDRAGARATDTSPSDLTGQEAPTTGTREITERALSIEDVPLRDVVSLIVDMVTVRGEIADTQLVDEFERFTGATVPRERRRLVTQFAWSASGRHYLDLHDRVWRLGERAAEPDARYGDWTFNRIVERARELLVTNDDPFEPLLREVYDSPRPSKLAMSIVGSAINAAKVQRLF